MAKSYGRVGDAFSKLCSLPLSMQVLIYGRLNLLLVDANATAVCDRHFVLPAFMNGSCIICKW